MKVFLISTVLLVVALAMIVSLLVRSIQQPNQGRAAIATASLDAEAPRCPPQIMTVEELQREVRVVLDAHAVHIFREFGLPENHYASSARSIIDTATGCWGLTYAQLKVSDGDLQAIGFKK